MKQYNFDLDKALQRVVSHLLIRIFKELQIFPSLSTFSVNALYPGKITQQLFNFNFRNKSTGN